MQMMILFSKIVDLIVLKHLKNRKMIEDGANIRY